MLESSWLFLGFTAVAITALALLTTDDARAILLGAIGFIAWGLWAYGSLNVIAPTGGVTYTASMPSLTIFGVLASLIPGYVALMGPVEVLDSRLRNPRQDEL